MQHLPKAWVLLTAANILLLFSCSPVVILSYKWLTWVDIRFGKDTFSSVPTTEKMLFFKYQDISKYSGQEMFLFYSCSRGDKPISFEWPQRPFLKQQLRTVFVHCSMNNKIIGMLFLLNTWTSLIVIQFICVNKYMLESKTTNWSASV